MSVAAKPLPPTYGRRAAIVIAMTIAAYALTLRVFYPGVMTWDAWYIHSYIANPPAGDWQSPVMTALWALIDPLAPGAASMFVLIATVYWLGFTVLALALARRSAWLAPAVILLALAPPAFDFVGIIWRDVLMVGSWLLAAALAYAVAQRPRDACRLAAQVLALLLLVFGFLLRPNGLFAAPILAAYLIWPVRFDLKRAAILYVPAVAALALLGPLVYYTMLGAKHEHVLHSIFVFDLGGISHFTKENQFPVTFSAEQNALVTDGCYKPTQWDIYWTLDPCKFVMQKLDREARIFGTPALTDAWLRAVMAHPLAYLEHRAAVMVQFLFRPNLTMFTIDIAHTDRTVFADNAWFTALVAVNDRLARTPVFLAGTWLIVCILWCALAWRRATPAGAFVLGTAGSAVVYMATFFPVGVSGDFRYALWAVLATLTGAVMLLVREA